MHDECWPGRKTSCYFLLSRDRCVRPPSKMAVWNAWIIRHMTLYFHPCQAISPFEKVRFRQQHRSWTDLSGNERGKRRNEEEKGFDMGWSGQTGIKTLYGRTKKSMSAECEVMCSLFDVILPELSYFFVAFRYWRGRLILSHTKISLKWYRKKVCAI